MRTMECESFAFTPWHSSWGGGLILLPSYIQVQRNCPKHLGIDWGGRIFSMGIDFFGLILKQLTQHEAVESRIPLEGPDCFWKRV